MPEVIFRMPSFHFTEDANFVFKKFLKEHESRNSRSHILGESERFRKTSLDDVKFSRFVIPLIVTDLYFVVGGGFTYIGKQKRKNMISAFVKVDIPSDVYKFISEYIIESVILSLNGYNFGDFANRHFDQGCVVKISPLLTPNTSNDYMDFRCTSLGMSQVK